MCADNDTPEAVPDFKVRAELLSRKSHLLLMG
jgi:hypothetical protein